jgi:hypothetical protein
MTTINLAYLRKLFALPVSIINIALMPVVNWWQDTRSGKFEKLPDPKLFKPLAYVVVLVSFAIPRQERGQSIFHLW